ncbi:hypothetical protein GIY11_02135 [Aerococcaceae bacterium DSM 109653]|uniref:Glycosyltransferase n=1 Tax=Fundicoccus ignavus TaxID=2664442 RepID=A0A844BKZ6_9LACT|nr:hypothetical protein [Fundicoccus ignavus]MRI80828.1 hypothetical protein [Fundicoccus ignavus]
MKKSMLLAEYLNYVNEDSEAIGHGKKVFQEALNLLKDHYAVTCTSSDAYRPEGWRGKYRSISAISQSKKGLQLNIEVFKNIHRIFINSSEDILWFTNVEWRLLAYLALRPKKSKVMLTIYRDIIKDLTESSSKTKWLKLALVRRGLQRTDLVIVTNKNLNLSSKQVFLPDYYYSEQYQQYYTTNKSERILCLGSMRASKDLRGVVRHFSGTDIPVYIVGSFADKNELTFLRENSNDNIRIEDRVVPYDEYYRLIANSRFTIMPYDMRNYEAATSGILQESIFLDAIPIAPMKLLDFNSVSGIGYDQLSDLPMTYQDLIAESDGVDNSKDEFSMEIILNRILTQIESF